MKITKRDVFSPANASSLIGLGLVAYGSIHITTLSGVLFIGLGRFLDIFDGKIARATHTSPFGALVDATCDKLGLAVLIPAAWISHVAPYWLLSYILIQNVANVVLSLWNAARGGIPSASRFGKHALFIQNISLGSYALGNVIDNGFFKFLGLVLGIASIAWAVRATYGYTRDLPKKVRP